MRSTPATQTLAVIVLALTCYCGGPNGPAGPDGTAGSPAPGSQAGPTPAPESPTGDEKKAEREAGIRKYRFTSATPDQSR